MDRLTRLTNILIQLQSKQLVVAKEIAHRFEISLRTVYRDIKTLQDAGVPIGSKNGRGYFLMDSFHLPPIMLTEQEANALVIAETMIRNQGDTSLQSEFTSLLLKIKSTLNSSQKESYEKLSKRISPSYLKEVATTDSLTQFKNAIVKNRVVQISYHSQYKDEKTTRSICPLGVYFSNIAWILVAYCNKKKALREFRLDRIIDYQITNKSFTNNFDFDLKQYFIEKYRT